MQLLMATKGMLSGTVYGSIIRKNVGKTILCRKVICFIPCVILQIYELLITKNSSLQVILLYT